MHRRNFLISLPFVPFVLKAIAKDAFTSTSTKNLVCLVSGHVKDPKIANQRDGRNINTPGAYSFSGLPEYLFNDEIVSQFNHPEKQIDSIDYHILLATRNIGLRQRAVQTNRLKPNLYIEIHHDSGQPTDIEQAKEEGSKSSLWNLMQGFSIHCSTIQNQSQKSLRFAELVANQFLAAGFSADHYHAKIEGMHCLDQERAIYHRELYLHRNITQTPTVIIECGYIMNPHEERVLSQPETKIKIVNSINQALKNYFRL